MKEQSFKQILESESYQNQRNVVFNEINGQQRSRRVKGIIYAPASSLPSFDRMNTVEREWFRQTATRDEVKTAKANTPKGKLKTHFKGAF